MEKEILQTERLIVREWNERDAERIFELNNNLNVLKYAGDPPFESIEKVIEFIQEYPNYQQDGFGRWAVIRKSDEIFIGWCGFKKHENGNIDLGFRFFEEEWNKGYATESAFGALKYGFEELGFERVIARANTENKASIQVLRKLGMREFERKNLKGLGDSVIFELTVDGEPEEYDKIPYPVVMETERLFIRPLVVEDQDKWVDFVMDEKATEFLPENMKGKSEFAQNWVQKQLGRYAQKTFGLHALFEKDSGEFVGQCGLLLQTIDGRAELEIGYHMLSKFWGRGYAPEAAKAFKKHAFENSKVSHIISIIDTENTNSQRVATKNGMRRTRITQAYGMDVWIYQVNR